MVTTLRIHGPRCVALVALLGAILLTSCFRSTPSGAPKEAGEPPWFIDVTSQSGLDFVHDAGSVDNYSMPQIVGSGAALFDYDNDGRLDIYLLQSGGPASESTNRLFHQRADGHFDDVSAGSGLNINGYNIGVAIGDVNNDGWPDVLVTQYGGVRLFLNNGNGTFTDVTKEAGLDNPLWATSASFFDYDRDGWLDLVLVNYVEYNPSRLCLDARGERDYCPPSQFPGSVTRLYHNLGKSGKGVRFEDMTIKSGLARLPGPGLGVTCADFNGDGWPDIFVANDGKANRLWINQHNGTFIDEAVARGVAYNSVGEAQANMGIGVADVDGDGLLDLFVTHLTEETNTLWRQGPPGFFHDATGAAGLNRADARSSGFGTVLADFNHDGWPDLALVSGRVARMRFTTPEKEGSGALGPFWSKYGERNLLLANDGTGHFRNISASSPALCGTPTVARGLACGDMDADGALDLLVTSIAGRARLYHNVAPNRGHWLLVRAVDPALKREAYGAVITVEAGGKSRVGLINPAYSYLCSNDPRAHFGLGSADRVDGLEILWPDGTKESFGAQPVDQIVLLRKGEGKARR